MLSALLDLRRTLVVAFSRVAFLGPLLARLSVGVMFAQSGWGKLGNLSQVIEFFESLGIPRPELQAPFVAGVELGCGLLLAVGLGSRLVSVPLMITMVVAILTAQRENITGFADLLALSEFTYIAVLLWVVLAGPGSVSLDALLLRWLGRSSDVAAPSVKAQAEERVLEDREREADRALVDQPVRARASRYARRA